MSHLVLLHSTGLPPPFMPFSMLLVCCVYNNKAVCEWKYLAKLASRLTNIGKDCHTVCQCAEIQAYFLSTSCAVPSSVGVSLYADFVFNPLHNTQKQNNRKKMEIAIVLPRMFRVFCKPKITHLIISTNKRDYYPE